MLASRNRRGELERQWTQTEVNEYSLRLPDVQLGVKLFLGFVFNHRQWMEA